MCQSAKDPSITLSRPRQAVRIWTLESADTMPSRKSHRTALGIILATAAFVVAGVCSLAAAGPQGVTAQADSARPIQNAAPTRNDRSAEFDRLSSRVLRLIQATEFNQALEPALKALQIAETAFSANDERLANIRNSLGVIYNNLGAFDKAEPLLFSAKSIWEDNKNRTMAAYADNNIGSLYLSLMRLDEAERFLRSALDIRRSALGERHTLTVATLHNLALTLIYEGRFAEGEEKMRQVIQAREELLGADNPLTLSSILMLGYSLIQESRLPEADQLMLSLLKAYRNAELTRDDGYLVTLNNLAFVRLRQGSYEDASGLLRELASLQAQKSGTHSLIYSVALTNLGRSEYLSKDYAAASATLNQALAIQRNERGVFQKYAAISTNNLGLVHFANQDFDLALATFRDAFDIAEKVFDQKNQFFSLVHHNIALSLARRGEFSAALEEARKAISFIPADNASQVLDIEAGFGMSANTYDDLYSDFISISKHLFDQNKSANVDLLPEAFRASQLASASTSSAALFLMSARFASGEGAVAKLIRQRQDLIGEWHALNRRIISGLSHVSAKPDLAAERAQADRLSALRTQIDQIEGQIAGVHPKFAELITPRPLEISETQNLLGEDEVLVNAQVGNNEISLWFITKNAIRWTTIPLGTSAIAEMVRTLRCGLDEQDWQSVQRSSRCMRLLSLTERPDNTQPLPFQFGIAHRLYNALFGEAADLIRNKQLLVVPSGPLTELPFHVLISEAPKMAVGRNYEDYRDIAWLARTQAITVLPSVASLRWLRAFAKGSSAPRSYLGFGDPVLHGDNTCAKGAAPTTCRSAVVAARDGAARANRRRSGAQSGSLEGVFARGAGPDQVRAQIEALCPLPDTSFEIKCVAQGFGVADTELHLGRDATEETLKALSTSGALAEYRVIHFATHGLIAGDIETIAKRQGEPALVLTPPQTPNNPDDDGLLTASEVAQLNLNADWVILSACNTAAAESSGAEALSGLARAFFYAGARALLVSHWPVYSDAAVRLVNDTFAQLRENNVGRAEALRRAMAAFIEDTTAPDNAHPSVWAPFVVVGEGAR
jgi:CHAT domain-containing protein/tetratricopeptide (TPR) repeat protein